MCFHYADFSSTLLLHPMAIETVYNSFNNSAIIHKIETVSYFQQATFDSEVKQFIIKNLFFFELRLGCATFARFSRINNSIFGVYYPEIQDVKKKKDECN